MGAGKLIVRTTTGDTAIPVENARVVVTQNGRVLYDTSTGAGFETEALQIGAPDESHTLDPNWRAPAYSVVDVTVTRPGFADVHIHNVEIVDTQTAILPVNMEPLPQGLPEAQRDYDIDPPAVADSEPRHQEGPPDTLGIPAAADARDMPAVSAAAMPDGPAMLNGPNMPAVPAVLSGRALGQVLIPDYITVHLGTPNNTAARNVRVRFADYIKNVASSEIYSTWPHNALVANIHVIVTYALNRVYTEWYRSRGYPFDITNSTAYDQAYRDGGPVYENISRIVDDIFNVYAHREGFRNPFFTSFCNGTTATCGGLSQWGTVSLANQGMTPLQILRYYYPNDLILTASNNIGSITESYPGYALTTGSQGEPVRRMQNYLNRIHVNFPQVPAISNPDGIFGPETRNAVLAFQRAFNLTPDGIIGRATWNNISFIFVGVSKLAELDSEGERIDIGRNPPNVVLRQGSRGGDVLELQFILNAISPYYPSVPTVIQDSLFGATTRNAVAEFQRTFGLTPDGVVGPATWNQLYAVYRGIHDNVTVPPGPPSPGTPAPPYPGTPLRNGSTGDSVRLMQTYLNAIRSVYTDIPALVADGVFGPRTQAAVTAFQREFGLTPDGIIGPLTWSRIVSVFQTVGGGGSLTYPGTPLRVGSSGNAVRVMQNYLAELHNAFPNSLPPVAVDGVFGAQTQAAVIAFQRRYGLTPDGVIGPLTWDAVVRERNKL